jgi:hypothetical protein
MVVPTTAFWALHLTSKVFYLNLKPRRQTALPQHSSVQEHCLHQNSDKHFTPPSEGDASARDWIA